MFCLRFQEKYNAERFLQISTDEVYGSLGAEGLFTEATPLSPNSPYSSSKAASDMMCQAFYHTYGMPILLPDVQIIMVHINSRKNLFL